RFACERELAINPDRQLPLCRRDSRARRATQKSIRCHIQVCAPLASQRRVHQCTGDASDPIIPTSTRVALPSPFKYDPEHILACPMILNYWRTSGKLAAQLAAKKKQSINSSCVASVLRSHRK